MKKNEIPSSSVFFFLSPNSSNAFAISRNIISPDTAKKTPMIPNDKSLSQVTYSNEVSQVSGIFSSQNTYFQINQSLCHFQLHSSLSQTYGIQLKKSALRVQSMEWLSALKLS